MWKFRLVSGGAAQGPSILSTECIAGCARLVLVSSPAHQHDVETKCVASDDAVPAKPRSCARLADAPPEVRFVRTREGRGQQRLEPEPGEQLRVRREVRTRVDTSGGARPSRGYVYGLRRVRNGRGAKEVLSASCRCALRSPRAAPRWPVARPPPARRGPRPPRLGIRRPRGRRSPPGS